MSKFIWFEEWQGDVNVGTIVIFDKNLRWLCEER